jgi:signal peptidase I
MFESIRKNQRRLAYTAAAAIVVLAAPLTVLRAYVISAPSMESTYSVGDHVIVTTLVGDLHHGDLIFFRYPEDRRLTFVKRVIGLPGDRIRIEDKEVFRNGERLIEPYASHKTAYLDTTRDNYAERVVPENSVFVLGDNRDNSADSRFWGFVPQSDIVARPWFVYWPAAK